MSSQLNQARSSVGSWALWLEPLVVPVAGSLSVAIVGGMLELAPISREWADRLTFGPPWIAAFLVGVMASFQRARWRVSWVSCFVWVVPLAALLDTLYMQSKISPIYVYWTAYLHNNCQGEECLDGIIVCVPMAVSIAYSLTSIGIWLHRWGSNPTIQTDS
jgi:hypothetical protein